jgi:hypothetical protein
VLEVYELLDSRSVRVYNKSDRDEDDLMASGMDRDGKVSAMGEIVILSASSPQEKKRSRDGAEHTSQCGLEVRERIVGNGGVGGLSCFRAYHDRKDGR